MAPANERQATPAASFDPDGVKKLLLRLFAAFRTLVFFWSNVPPGEARSPERQRGAGGGVSRSTTEEGGVGAGFRLHRPVNPFDQLDSPSPSGLVYLLPASFERFPSVCEPSSGRSIASHPTPTLRSPPAAPFHRCGGQGGEAEKKTVKNQYCVF